MPEGPEVFTIVEELNNSVTNKKIADVLFAKNADNLLKNTTQQAFIKSLVNQHITNVTRHGKYIDIQLSSQKHIVFHLLITGRLTLLKKGTTEYPKYFRCALVFDDETKLCLGDQMQWTKITLLENKQLPTYKILTSLGIDVLSQEFTLEKFKEILATRQSIYTLLLNQKKITGLGNIYVNEALFEAKIHPKTPANKVPPDKIEKLSIAINKIMKEAVQEKGTTVFSFLEKRPGSVGWHTLDGSPGGFWKHVKIFDKAGDLCPSCKKERIKKIRIGGRSAFFCPREQTLESHTRI